MPAIYSAIERISQLYVPLKDNSLSIEKVFDSYIIKNFSGWPNSEFVKIPSYDFFFGM